jgi:hypothetical protein
MALKTSFSREITDYMVWPLRLRSFLQGMEELSDQETASKGCSCLGRWLSQDGLTKFGDLPEVRELNHIHSEIHRSINRLVRMKKSGMPVRAQQELEKIDPLTRRIIFLLAAIERKIG